MVMLLIKSALQLRRTRKADTQSRGLARLDYREIVEWDRRTSEPLRGIRQNPPRRAKGLLVATNRFEKVKARRTSMVHCLSDLWTHFFV